MVDPARWREKKVLVTGHTGFKGSWLCHWLDQLGAEITGYALPAEGSDDLYHTLGLADRIHCVTGNLNDAMHLQSVVSGVQPDVIFHLGAQSLVRRSYSEPLETFATNIMGTANLLQAARCLETCDIVVVTSDKCYRNDEEARAFQEDDALGGNDPYSASKAGAEIVAASFRRSFFSDGRIRIATARAGNVIGGGDWAEDRFVPDLIRAWIKEEVLTVRNPGAVRPWQHVLEPLSGYLMLAEEMRRDIRFARSWNFGPASDEVVSVSRLLEIAMAELPDRFPPLVSRCDAEAGPAEANMLMLDATAAQSQLGWKPAWAVDVAIRQTLNWYTAWREGRDVVACTSDQINQYCQAS